MSPYPEEEMLHSTCSCYSTEHTLRWSYDPVEKEFYTEVFLNQYRGFFKRAWIGLKYVFGYKCRYGHWDCTTLRKDEALKLRDFINRQLSHKEDLSH